MKAALKPIRIDLETDEDEVVFEVIPKGRNGAYPKNRWFVRYPLSLAEVHIDQIGEQQNTKIIFREAKKLISECLEIDVDSANALPY